MPYAVEMAVPGENIQTGKGTTSGKEAAEMFLPPMFIERIDLIVGLDACHGRVSRNKQPGPYCMMPGDKNHARCNASLSRAALYIRHTKCFLFASQKHESTSFLFFPSLAVERDTFSEATRARTQRGN
jgi:hypothetical protein